MIKGNPARVSIVALAADGTPATGLTPTVQIRVDGTAWKAATNAPTETKTGFYEVLLDGGETAADDLEISWEDAAIVPINQVVHPIDPDLFKADVTNLDVAVSTRASSTALSSTNSEIAKIIKDGEQCTWTSGLGTRGDVTIRRNANFDPAQLGAGLIQFGADNV